MIAGYTGSSQTDVQYNTIRNRVNERYAIVTATLHNAIDLDVARRRDGKSV